MSARMPTTREIFAAFPSRYIPGKLPSPRTFYFSIGEEKWSVRLDPAACTVTPGKIEGADCVVKSDPKVFEALVMQGKAPGALDIARGKFKTNDPSLLMALKDCFRMP
jgi:long-chain acyl-CoA synthetase